MASSWRALARSSASGTNRNSARGSMNRLMSQGQATRSTLTFCLVIHRMGSPLPQRVIQAFCQLHPAVEEFRVTQVLLRPPFHDLIDAETFSPSELLVEQIRVVNDLTHDLDNLVADAKRLG